MGGDPNIGDRSPVTERRAPLFQFTRRRAVVAAAVILLVLAWTRPGDQFSCATALMLGGGLTGLAFTAPQELSQRLYLEGICATAYAYWGLNSPFYGGHARDGATTSVEAQLFSAILAAGLGWLIGCLIFRFADWAARMSPVGRYSGNLFPRQFSLRSIFGAMAAVCVLGAAFGPKESAVAGALTLFLALAAPLVLTLVQEFYPGAWRAFVSGAMIPALLGAAAFGLGYLERAINERTIEAVFRDVCRWRMLLLAVWFFAALSGGMVYLVWWLTSEPPDQK